MPDALTLALNLPFQAQIDFFRAKLNLPTERWDDIWKGAHDRAFVVAGAMKADLLADLREAVAPLQRTTLEQFRKDFRAIVQKHGWHGWTGEGTKAGEAWRTRVIYETNVRASHAAGRYRQLTDPKTLQAMPFWRYVHNDSVMHPRLQHQAWGDAKLTLPHEHDFWKTHFPPNGWGCRCRVVAVRAPREGDATTPPAGWAQIDAKTGEQVGIDKGWGYAPGASWKPWDKTGGLPDCNGVAVMAADRNLCLAPLSGQRNWKDLGRPDLRDVPASARLSAPPLLGRAGSRNEAVARVAEALGLSVASRWATVDTPVGTIPLAYDRIPHMVAKEMDGRERYANFILPTLRDPYEVYATLYKEGIRPRFIGLFNAPRQIMVVVRMTKDGRLVWNFMQASDKNMNAHRVGELLYGK